MSSLLACDGNVINSFPPSLTNTQLTPNQPQRPMLASHDPPINDRERHHISELRSPSPPVRHDTGFFTNAHDFAVHGGLFMTQTNNYVNNTISNRKAVFEFLKPYTCLDATKDSSARHPPPRCHPGTREKIRERLMRWLANEDDQWKMLWVRGFAGTGKSAVAQSFADSCDEEESLGGSYFFSRAAGRNKTKTVVPTLVYQLAENIPEYQSFIEHRLARNPSVLHSSPPVQFRKLIVEPFAILQRERPRKPIALVLDGLDECEGEHAQKEMLDMITDAIRTNPDLPLRWLIFSRPEAHLKNAFSTNLECGRDELIIDAECRANVETYVKDKLLEIKAAYDDVTPPDWPSQNQLRELLDTVSGLFVFASTCLNYIGDPDEADPDAQLEALLTFTRRLRGVASRNPLQALDHFYSRILEGVSRTVSETTWRILAYLLYWFAFDQCSYLGSAQVLCNFLQLDQRAFYKAVRGLHSIVNIPRPEDANKSQLQFHHTSFHDFLLNPIRSQKFSSSIKKGLVDIIGLGIYWNELDVTLFHSSDGSSSDFEHNHDSFPDLTWATDDNRRRFSQSIINLIRFGLFQPSCQLRLGEIDKSPLSNVNFRLWRAINAFHLVRICGLDPSTSIVRVEPSDPTDHQLFKYFNLMIKNGVAEPATFPPRNVLPDGQRLREYFFVGRGVESSIIWRTKSPTSGWHIHSLYCDREPSDAQISQHQKLLQSIGWEQSCG